MPNCFQLINRETGEPEAFNVIDDKMCHHFGVPVDSKEYHMDWYGIAGFKIATGHNLEEQIADGRSWIAVHPNDTYAIGFLDVLVWLDTHYTSDAWVSRVK